MNEEQSKELDKLSNRVINIFYVCTRGLVDIGVLFAWAYLALKYNVWWSLIFPTISTLISTYYLSNYLQKYNKDNTCKGQCKKHKLEE